MNSTEKLIELLSLEDKGNNVYEGQNTDVGNKFVFGGQVLAQGLYAAYQTVTEERFAHSLHAYFLLPGDLTIPITFEVDPIRDGGSFTTRRVIAKQRGKAIFNMAASFHKREEGFEHQADMPQVMSPEELPSWKDIATKMVDILPEITRRFLGIERPVEFKSVELINPMIEGIDPPYRHTWMKCKGNKVEDQRLRDCILAYISDYNLLTAALQPHKKATFISTQLASLDHAMWFHHEDKLDDWLLYAVESPSASSARGFSRGQIFNRSGKLIASVAQEGLMRYRTR